MFRPLSKKCPYCFETIPIATRSGQGSSILPHVSTCDRNPYSNLSTLSSLANPDVPSISRVFIDSTASPTLTSQIHDRDVLKNMSDMVDTANSKISNLHGQLKDRDLALATLSNIVDGLNSKIDSRHKQYDSELFEKNARIAALEAQLQAQDLILKRIKQDISTTRKSVVPLLPTIHNLPYGTLSLLGLSSVKSTVYSSI